MPDKLHSRMLVMFLNKILSQQLDDGDIDFLNHRRLSIKVKDIGISYCISLSQGRLVTVMTSGSDDLMIEASVYDFLLLAGREEDPDTLMFQRRLLMQGDTELGLELKNFLDGLDIESNGSYAIIESLLHKGLPIYRRLFGAGSG